MNTKPTHILINENRYRDLAIALLDDDHGITEGAYHILIELMPDELYDEIVLKVRGNEGRIYLPQGVLK